MNLHIERLVLEILAYHRENHLTEQRVNDMVLAAIELSWGAIRAHKEHMRMVFEAILREGVERGELEAVDPRETSRLLMISPNQQDEGRIARADERRKQAELADDSHP